MLPQLFSPSKKPSNAVFSGPVFYHQLLSIQTQYQLYGSIKFHVLKNFKFPSCFLNSVGFNLEMLYRNRHGKFESNNTIIFKTFSIQCPKHSMIAFLVKGKFSNFICRLQFTQLYLFLENIM